MNFQALLNPFRSLPPISSNFSQLTARKPPRKKKEHIHFIAITIFNALFSSPKIYEISMQYRERETIHEKTNSHSRSSKPTPAPIDLVTSQPPPQDLHLNQPPLQNHRHFPLSPTALQPPPPPPVTDTTEAHQPWRWFLGKQKLFTDATWKFE